MKVLVFEFMTGGGVADQHPLNDELSDFLRQGRSMLEAVCEDFLEIGAEVTVPIDSSIELSLSQPFGRLDVARENELDSILVAAAEHADHILLIAPESEGCLAHFAERLSPWANRFISPDLEFIRLTGNKWNCHQWLVERAIPCPKTLLMEPESAVTAGNLSFPLVAKPIDGAGSEGVRMIASEHQLAEIARPFLVQQFIPGTAVSVSVIADGDGNENILEPGRQIFDTEPFGVYLRAEVPLDSGLKVRALNLAKKLVAALPQTRGHFGIDMVLGNSFNEDFIIEINPRLTTSYVFLKQNSRNNLAAMMLAKQ